VKHLSSRKNKVEDTLDRIGPWISGIGDNAGGVDQALFAVIDLSTSFSNSSTRARRIVVSSSGTGRVGPGIE
jgi:hypothetical protein